MNETERTLTPLEQKALDYFGLEFVESDEDGAGWFAYEGTQHHPDYPGSSCECVEDVVDWYVEALEAGNGRLRERLDAAERIFDHLGLDSLARWENQDGESARHLVNEYVRLTTAEGGAFTETANRLLETKADLWQKMEGGE